MNDLYYVTIDYDGTIRAWIREKRVFRRPVYREVTAGMAIGKRRWESAKQAWKFLIRYDCGYE